MALSDIRTATPIAREVLEGRPLQQMQEVALRSTAALNAMPLQPGVMVTFAFGGAATIAMSHGLGRPPRGWFVVDRDSAATVYRSAWDRWQLTLVGSAACNAVVWVF